jgi:replication-associated recombination protein RarA
VVKKAIEEKEFILNTAGGYPLDEVRSSIQKALRIGDEESAAYWAMEMIEGGFWRYLLKTCQCIAVEDIGLGDPQVIVVTTAVKEAIEFKMEKKGLVPTEIIGFLILYLARAKKNREGDDFIEYIQARRKQGWKLEVPEVALDAHCKRGRQRLKEAGINPNEEFYKRGSKLKNEVILQGNKYRKRILEIYGLKEER